MKTLSGNIDLYRYLLALACTLSERQADGLGYGLLRAAAQASSSSTEFLGESRIALRRLYQDGKEVLNTQELQDILDVVQQIDSTFHSRA